MNEVRFQEEKHALHSVNKYNVFNTVILSKSTEGVESRAKTYSLTVQPLEDPEVKKKLKMVTTHSKETKGHGACGLL